MRSPLAVALMVTTLILPTTLAGTTVITDPAGDTDLLGAGLCRADALDILSVTVATDADALTVRLALRDLDAAFVCEAAGLLAGARPVRSYDVSLLPPEICNENGCGPDGSGVELMADFGDPLFGDSSCALVFAPDGKGDYWGYCEWVPATRDGDAIVWSLPLVGTVPMRDDGELPYDLRGASLTVESRAGISAFVRMNLDRTEPTSVTL